MVNNLQGATLSGGSVSQTASPGNELKTGLSWPKTVYIVTTKKGGAGKTETSECLEAISTMSGQRCLLVDVDDGNRGLGRRVGLDRVIKVSWDVSVSSAVQWVADHAPSSDTMIFDLGAGIDSSDLPITAFLSSVWRKLADGGARIVICAVVSTNAPTSNYIERLAQRFEALGELLIVYNNQDGSEEFSEELAELSFKKVGLGQLPSGIQAVRLSRRDLLSTIVRTPSPGYTLASAYMAKRIHALAQQPFFTATVASEAIAELAGLSATAPRRYAYSITKRAHASDDAIQQNARVAGAQTALLAPALDDEALLLAAKSYRSEYATYWKLLRTPNS